MGREGKYSTKRARACFEQNVLGKVRVAGGAKDASVDNVEPSRRDSWEDMVDSLCPWTCALGRVAIVVEASGMAYDIGRHNFDMRGDDGSRAEACRAHSGQVVHWERVWPEGPVTAPAAGGSWLGEGATHDGERSLRQLNAVSFSGLLGFIILLINN